MLCSALGAQVMIIVSTLYLPNTVIISCNVDLYDYLLGLLHLVLAFYAR